jgi:phosphomannomutase
MPTISEFFGILILMFFDDHAPPHFHARYGGDEVVIQIKPVGVLRGKIPPRALSLVIEWAQKYQQNLMEEWNHAANNKKLHKIPPLD